MSDILVASVGNSPEPIQQCIGRIRPRRVVFVCSDDTRRIVDELREQVRLDGFDPERDLEVLRQSNGQHSDGHELDQLHCVYRRCRALLERLRQEEPSARITVDYTGGTKTMGAGLALASIDDGRVELCFTGAGNRKPGQPSISGNVAPVIVESGAIQAQRLLSDALPPLLQRHDYAAAQAALAAVRRLHHDQRTEQLLRQLDDLLLGLDAWDRWDLKRAESLLKDHAQDEILKGQLLFPLQRVILSCTLLDQQVTKEKTDSPADQKKLTPAEKAEKDRKRGKIHGLEAVEDLLLNADRRAQQERYDDAVGRLYRAMELTAQSLLLLNHGGIRTANVELELLPEALRASYAELQMAEHGRIQLALTASFDLLAALQDPAGLIWQKDRKTFVDALKTRNHSLLAHGFTPVGYRQWNTFNQALGNFLRSILEDQRGSLPPLSQLPTQLHPFCQPL